METNNHTIEMEIFRAGDYGAKGRYSEAELEALAEDYRPELLEAPLTFDHAQSGPAYGWVTSLRRNGDRLLAVLRGVPDSVRQLVRSGAFKQRSVELVREMKDTGRPYLRAVSLLGAATPEVKGLSEIRFSAAAEAEQIAIAEFATEPQEQPQTEGGHSCPPGVEVVQAANSAAADDEPAALLRDGTEYVRAQLELPLDTIASDGGQECPPPDTASDARQVDDELAQLQAQIAALQRELRGQAADAVFAELRGEGYALPDRHITALRHCVQAMHKDVIHFSETESLPVADWLREFLRATSPRVPLGTAARVSCSAPGAFPPDLHVQFSARTDPDSIDLHHRAVALMQHEPALAYSAALSLAAKG